MRTENFDDLIRGKLEEGVPFYRDEELDRVQNHVTQNQTKDDRKRMLLIGFYSLAGLLLAGLLIWDLVQYKENKKLTQALASLKPVHAEAKPRIENLKEGSIEEKRKWEALNGNSAQTNFPAKNNYSQKNNYAANSKALFKEAKLIPEESITVDQRSILKYEESASVVDSIGMTGVPLSPSSADPAIVSSAISSTVPTTTSAPDPAIVPASDKYLHYLAGAVIEVANGHNAISLIGEMMLGSKWSISTGIKFVQMDDDGEFFDNEDFENKKGHDYSAPCTTCSMDSGPHQDVHYKFTLVQIPLALNYYIDLRNNFALFPGLGTDLDVYAKQQIDVDNFPAGIPANLPWTSRCPTLVFNNAKFSLGIQKQWKHFVLKAIPFVSKQLTAVDYKAESWYYGLQLSGLYVF